MEPEKGESASFGGAVTINNNITNHNSSAGPEALPRGRSTAGPRWPDYLMMGMASNGLLRSIPNLITFLLRLYNDYWLSEGEEHCEPGGAEEEEEFWGFGANLQQKADLVASISQVLLAFAGFATFRNGSSKKM